MRRLIDSLVLAGVLLVLALVASPSATALPSKPTAPCLPGGVCLPGQLPDPCADPACLVPPPGVPNEVPPLRPAPSVDAPPLPAEVPLDVPPRPADVPGQPTDSPADGAADGPTAPAPAADVPTPVPGAAVPESTSSSDSGAPDSAPAPGGGRPRPVSVDTSSVSSRPAALAHAARSFVLLFVLAGLVGAYLIVQGRLDARDPKLAAAPIDRDDEIIRFR